MAGVLTQRAMKLSKWSRAYALAMATLYLLYGLLQLYNGLAAWWLPWLGDHVELCIRVLDICVPNTFPDPFSGLVLMLVGLILVRAVYLYSRENYVKAASFLFAGWAFGVLLMILNVLMLLADILGAYYPLLLGGEATGWSLASDPWGIAPHMILGALLLPLYLSAESIREILRSLSY